MGYQRDDPKELQGIMLEKRKLQIANYLTEEMINDVQLYKDDMLGMMVLKMAKDVVAYKCGSRLIRFPQTWLDAVKERWLPEWAKKRYPVRYREYNALTIFPNFLKDHPVPFSLRKDQYYFTFIESQDNPFRG